jgi:hypothetical protein
LSAVTPLQPGAGNQATATGLRLGAAAVATAGDAVDRKSAIGAVPDTGLHGGTVSYSQGGRLLHLHQVEFVPGVSVTGTVVATATKDVADVTVTGPDGTSASLTARWAPTGAAGSADVDGTVGGLVLTGACPAP